METGNMRYAADKPEECIYCYFWQKRKGRCERKSCYYLVEQGKEQESDKEEAMPGDCRFCPYGRHSPCIGYCLAKILLEMKDSYGK